MPYLSSATAVELVSSRPLRVMAAKFDAVLDDIRKFTKVVHEAQQKQPQRQQ